jgi:hypothetical protein
MSHRADKFKSDHVYKISSFVDGTVRKTHRLACYVVLQ